MSQTRDSLKHSIRLEEKVPIPSLYDASVDNSAALGIQRAVCIFFSSCIKSDVMLYGVLRNISEAAKNSLLGRAGFRDGLDELQAVCGEEFRGLALFRDVSLWRQTDSFTVRSFIWIVRVLVWWSSTPTISQVQDAIYSAVIVLATG